VKKKPNPAYQLKPGETASDRMRRLRKEFPTKFGMQKGQKVKKKKFTAADMAEAEKRGAEKAAAELKAATPAPAPVKTNSETPAAAPAATPATAAQSAPAPASVSAPTATPAPAPVTPPDPQIVSEADIFSPPPPQDQTAGPETAGPGATTPPPASPASGAKADGGKYGAMIWAMIVKLFVGFFGPGFEPITVKDSAGQILYDEGAEGLKVWINYLESLGIKTFSPVVELWIFMASYVGLRAGLIVQKFKNRKKAGAPTQPPQSGQSPQSPPQKPDTAQGTATPQKPPAPAPTTPPAPASPQTALGEIETGETEI
jgi:hypothetical protein